MVRHLPIFLLLALGCAQPPAPEPMRPKNLVVVCLDTVRFDTFGVPEEVGVPDDLGPRLKDALVLENNQAPSPWTVPSVASVLTGLYPNQHGAGRFASEVANLNEEVPAGLAEGLETLPEILSAHGYETEAIVAHPWFKAGYGLDRGFASLTLRKGATEILAAARGFLDRRQGPPSTDLAPKPFLLYLHFMEAHGARRLRGSDLEETIARLPAALKPSVLAGAPGNSCRKPESQRCQIYQAYVVTVLELRQSIAGLLAELDVRGLSEDTITVVYSDHGEEFFDHYQAQKSLGLLPPGRYGRGHGHSLFQELLHVPTLIWHPDHPGRALEKPTSLIDLMPALLEWLAIPSPRPRWPGVSISDVVAASDGETASDRHLFSSAIAYGPEQVAVRIGDWKRIRYTAEQGDLFHLERDPAELEPLVDDAVASDLDRRLDDYLTAEAAPGEAVPELSAEELERLQSLGYLQGVKRQD